MLKRTFAILLVVGAACGGASRGPRDDAREDGLENDEIPAGDAWPEALDGPGADAAETPATEPVLWRWATETPPVADPWFQDHKEFTEFLSFCFHRGPAEPEPDASHLGDYAVGNGFVFAELGLTFPLNTLHGMTGPTYTYDGKFYSDLRVQLADEGGPVPFDEEWVCANRSLPTVVSVGRVGDAYLTVVDLAPLRPADEAARPVHQAIWRKVRLTNRSRAVTRPLRIVVSAAVAQQVEGPAIVERREHSRRVVFFRHADAQPSPDGLSLEVGALRASGAVEADLVVATGPAEARAPALVQAFEDESFETLAQQTRAAYQAFEQAHAEVQSPDPVVNDFFSNLLRTLFVQVSAQGGASPMSRYTSVWTRDLSGVIRPLVAMGAFEFARRLLEYYRLAACRSGDIRNAYDADLSLDGSECDGVTFEHAEAMTGKCAAEGPAHLPILYGWLYDALGDPEDALRALPMLRRSVFGEAWNDRYLLPFSGDETFRAAMNAAFGLFLEYPHQTESFSLVSGYLLAAAALRLAAFEQMNGAWAARDEALQLAAAVEQATRDEYLLEDGCRAALIHRADGSRSPPFEDALLTGPWVGPPFGDDEAEQVVACLLSRIPHDEDLLVLSPLHPSYLGVLPMLGDEGMYTGMLPGYTLRAIAMASHPRAEAAFNALRASLSPSGNYAEYMVAKDCSALQIDYDPIGGLGDYTARFRPWEGGINLEAAFYYLTGYEPDAEAGIVRLKPHLPNQWPSLAVRRMRVKDSRFDLEVVRLARDGLRMSVTPISGSGFNVQFVTEHATGTPRATLNGSDSAPEATRVRSGVRVLRWPVCAVEVGRPCTLTVQPD